MWLRILESREPLTKRLDDKSVRNSKADTESECADAAGDISYLFPVQIIPTPATDLA